MDVRVGAADADVLLYHIGNNPLHRDIYAAALNKPGVVVLHDAVLHHLLLGWLSRDEYLREFEYNYGSWSRGLGEDLWRDRARSSADPRYFECGMLRRIAEASTAVIVHNPAAAAAVTAHAPAARVVEIPHLLLRGPVPSAPETIAARSRLGIDGAACLFGVFGHLRESKRLPVVLRSVKQLRAEGVNCALLVAGHFVSEALEQSLETALHCPGIYRAGYLPEADFTALMAAVDACINLRYPAAGETSGIAIRAMGMGKPVILTNGLDTLRYPETVCLRVMHDESESQMLQSYMRWMCDCPEGGREIGRRAAVHIAERHSPADVARQYAAVLAEAAAVAHK